MKPKKITLNCNSFVGRINLIKGLALSGYKVWTEEKENSKGRGNEN